MHRQGEGSLSSHLVHNEMISQGINMLVVNILFIVFNYYAFKPQKKQVDAF